MVQWGVKELNFVYRLILPLRFSPPLSRSWSGVRLHHSSRLRCRPSTLYTFPVKGLARRWHFTAFADFERFYFRSFPLSTHCLEGRPSKPSRTLPDYYDSILTKRNCQALSLASIKHASISRQFFFPSTV